MGPLRGPFEEPGRATALHVLAVVRLCVCGEREWPVQGPRAPPPRSCVQESIKQGSPPHLMLLDVMMPGLSG